MYTLLVRLMLLAAMLELGLSITDLSSSQKVSAAAKKIIAIQWKPISVFPEEAKRFR